MLSPLPALLLTLAVGALPQQPPAGTPTTPPAAAEPSTGSAELPVDVEKIQRALSRPPAFTTRSDRPVFRVEILGRKPSIEEILGPDYLKGPVPYGGMTHQEFLSMVTPEEFRGYSMFTNKEALTLAASSFALQWALMKAVDKLKDARTERAKEAARQEVLAAMNELEAARKRLAEQERLKKGGG